MYGVRVCQSNKGWWNMRQRVTWEIQVRANDEDKSPVRPPPWCTLLAGRNSCQQSHTVLIGGSVTVLLKSIHRGLSSCKNQ